MISRLSKFIPIHDNKLHDSLNTNMKRYMNKDKINNVINYPTASCGTFATKTTPPRVVATEIVDTRPVNSEEYMVEELAFGIGLMI